MIKYLICGLLVAVAVVSVKSVSPDDPCTDGDTTSFDNGCNTCTCGNGVWACTEKFCLNLGDSRDKRETISPEDKCQDGDSTSFDNGCNTCTCMGGMWACTLKLCLEAVPYQSRLAKREASPPKECKPQSTKQEDCNSCWCTETGIWICTKKACAKVKRAVTSPEEKCQDGDTTSFDNGCNTCTCMNGHWACTLKFCFDAAPSHSSIAKREVSFDMECEPNTTKQEIDFGKVCRICWCTLAGTWSCRERTCPVYKREVARECNPGDSKLEDCNHCSCTETGLWICTKVACNRKREAIVAGFQARILN